MPKNVVSCRLPAGRQGFTLMELIIVVAIMLILASVGFTNFIFSLKKSHDAQRKSDLATIAKGLEAFASDWSDYPDDNDAGKMKACDDTGSGLGFCDFGDPMAAFFKGVLVTYLAKIPNDPISGQTYFYEKTSTGYNIYAGLENTADPYYKSGLLVSCGDVTCNYTLTQGGVQ